MEPLETKTIFGSIETDLNYLTLQCWCCLWWCWNKKCT